LLDGRQDQADQHADDGDDDQHLDQREGTTGSGPHDQTSKPGRPWPGQPRCSVVGACGGPFGGRGRTGSKVPRPEMQNSTCYRFVATGLPVSASRMKSPNWRTSLSSNNAYCSPDSGVSLILSAAISISRPGGNFAFPFLVSNCSASLGISL